MPIGQTISTPRLIDCRAADPRTPSAPADEPMLGEGGFRPRTARRVGRRQQTHSTGTSEYRHEDRRSNQSAGYLAADERETPNAGRHYGRSSASLRTLPLASGRLSSSVFTNHGRAEDSALGTRREVAGVEQGRWRRANVSRDPLPAGGSAQRRRLSRVHQGPMPGHLQGRRQEQRSRQAMDSHLLSRPLRRPTHPCW